MGEKLYATIGTEVREFTEAEYAQHEIDETQALKQAAENIKMAEARDRKRQEVLDRLGITAEELKTILS